MDVVDLYDYIQTFSPPRKASMSNSNPQPGTKADDSASTQSSVTLPMSGSHHEGEIDVEKAAAEPHRPETPQQPVNKVVTAQDWAGPDDPENPENWSSGKKAYHVAYIGLQAFIVTFGSSVYTPAVPGVAQRFNVSAEAAILPLTLYVLGLAFGPVISAPISETYGRSIVYLTLFPVSLLFTLGAGLSQSYAALMVCRFLAGTIGSACLAVGAGSMSDMYPPMVRAAVSCVFLLAPFAGPAVGPVAGSYLAEYKDWRWTQWIILMIGLLNLIMGLFQKESYKKIILAKRAKRLGLPPPPNPMAVMKPVQKLKFILTVTITRPVVMLFTEPIVTFLAIYTAFNFGVLFCFFAAFPLVFRSSYPEIQAYHFSLGGSGLVFLAIGVGISIASVGFAIGDKMLYQPRARRMITEHGKSPNSLLLPPEARVWGAAIGSFFLPIGLFWFAWTARTSIHWIVPVIAMVFFGAGNMLVFFTAVMYQLDSYGPLMGASAMAANGILRYVFGAVFPLFARQMYLSLGTGWATSLLGFVTVALMPLPWILLKYGPVIRRKSKYATFSANM